MAAFKEGLEGFALKHRQASLLLVPSSQSKEEIERDLAFAIT